MREPVSSRTLWATGFPDGRVEIENVIEDGDKVVLEFTGRGTHTGPLRTPMGASSTRLDKPLVLEALRRLGRHRVRRDADGASQPSTGLDEWPSSA